MKKTYTIGIEEHINKAFEIEAETAEEAMEIAEKRYWSGEYVLDGESNVSSRQMCVCYPDDEATEWSEFDYKN